MEATLKLNLSDALNADELRELTEIARRERKPLERVLYEAAKALADGARSVVAPAPSPSVA